MKNPNQVHQPTKELLWLAHVVGLWTHTIGSEKWTSRGLKKLLMTCNYGMCTSDQEWIKLRIKTPICLNSKGNEIITWCSFCIGSCLFFNIHHCCMCYCCQCSLNHIYVSWVNNDNAHQSRKVVSSNKNIHLSLDVLKEEVGNLPLNMCSVFQSNSYNNIPTCVMNYYMFTSTWHQANGYLDC